MTVHRLLLTLLLIGSLLIPTAAGAARSGCDNPEDLPVLDVGATTLLTDGVPMPGSTDWDAANVDVIIDVPNTRAARLGIEVDWSSPHELFHFYVVNSDRDEHKAAVRAGATPNGERTRQATEVLVEDCEIITVQVIQITGTTLEPVEVDFTVEPHDMAAPRATGGPKDVVVVAVIDSGFNPYHLEFRADGMPGRRLPLDRAPHEWISGFPDPAGAFEDYRALNLTLPTAPDAIVAEARAADEAIWAGTAESTPDSTSYYWVPSTKAVGAVDFSGQWSSGGEERVNLNAQHAARTSSVAVGNSLGHCPECVFVMIVTDLHDEEQAAAARRWAHAQSWIDVISDASWTNDAFRAFPVEDGPFRAYNSGTSITADPAPSLEATIRGQQRFMAAGNGAGVFSVPNSTYFTESGFDWVTTVGGVMDRSADDPGATRNVDVAAASWDWSVVAGETISSTGHGDQGSTGTSASNSAVAGIYARALAVARQALPGPSRAQVDGAIATGPARPCDCPLRDGVLTRAELVDHLYRSADLVRLDRLGLRGVITTLPNRHYPAERERDLIAQGHGTFFGRQFGDVAWHDEVDRIVAPVLGEREAPRITDDVVEFMTVDSFCRQQIWGDWDEGLFKRGDTTLPGADSDWPVRSSLEAVCTDLVVSPVGR